MLRTKKKGLGERERATSFYPCRLLHTGEGNLAFAFKKERPISGVNNPLRKRIVFVGSEFVEKKSRTFPPD